MRFFTAIILAIIAGCTPAPEPSPRGVDININVPGAKGEIHVPPPPRRVDVDVRKGHVDVNGTHIDWKEDKK